MRRVQATEHNIATANMASEWNERLEVKQTEMERSAADDLQVRRPPHRHFVSLVSALGITIVTLVWTRTRPTHSPHTLARATIYQPVW